MSSATKSPDFEDEFHFPSFGDLPHEYFRLTRHLSEARRPTAHWCFLAEIAGSIPSTRPVYRVTDREGFEYLVAFYLQDRTRFPAVREKCTEGHTMCIMYAVQHTICDGKNGVMVDDERTVKVLPCSLETLFSIRHKVLDNRNVCNTCGSFATLKCSSCTLNYCNKTCQLKDWDTRSHKSECRVAQQIIKWTSFNWSRFERAKLFEI